MYGLYIDDVKGTCSPITDTMCVKYKKKILLLFWACKSRAVTLYIYYPGHETREIPLKTNLKKQKSKILNQINIEG
jgi:hypothetical protein